MKTIRDIENELTPHLISEEKLVWSGRPKTGFVLRGSDAYLIPFSLAWSGIAIFFQTGSFFAKAPAQFKLVGIPFLFVAFYITIGRFLVDMRKRSRTVYGITPNRIIIISGIFFREVKSVNIHALPDLSIHQRTDKSGTITLGQTDPRYVMTEAMHWPGVKPTPRLELIPDVKRVFELILDLQRQRDTKD
ncbi:MAG: hypothetical protein ACK500_08415 [Flavobacteriales bacterium]